MPRTIRQSKSDLRKAGFIIVKGRGKGSHILWELPGTSISVNLSGQDGDDAEPYQERDVRGALAKIKSSEGPR